ncbi:polyprenyl synthetase family protein [Heliorestis convoluta]|uniref:Heptaprenyl diphosphate synthase component 2 n=1 Tax=Heliorestis convoluta TaxID=356322 RepID=A0A5Q2N1Q2_9FIRM|nr:polyprenyl synthetase family protein [Heliorestis convoluta]QGG47763.1 heptaprenyl diphosphate synthase component 2 [Heliorestis convoluta]
MAFHLFQEIEEDLRSVEAELNKQMETTHPTITAASSHLLLGGGKRLRPAFVLLAGKLYNYQLNRLLPLAVALEMVHMATLVHDDVIDESKTRRGIATVRARWGNKISIHTGDHLFARALILIAELGDSRITQLLAKASVQMCEGEIQQMESTFNVNQSFRDYLYRINRKTALLLSLSCQLGAMAVQAEPRAARTMKWYGHHLGMAFQITDDILDLVANEEELGKPVGSDLRQGIMTLPILTATVRDPLLKDLVHQKEKTEEEVKEAIERIVKTGAIEESKKVALLYLQKAKKELDHLPDSSVKESFHKIADFIAQRNY